LHLEIIVNERFSSYREENIEDHYETKLGR